MSEEQKTKRTSQDIQREYQEACFKIGDLEHKIDVFTRDQEMLKGTIRDLDLEFTKLRQQEIADAKAAETPKETPNV